MEQPPTEVINREANLKAVKQLLKGVNSTIKAIRKTDDCRILEYIQQQIQDLLIYIRQDLTTIEVTGTLPPLEDNDRFNLGDSQEIENSDPDLSKIYLNSPRNESQLSV